MRKSIDGLAALVEQEMDLSPAQEVLFVFCNRGRDKIKLLYWERNGFVVWYKRLEKQRFCWLRLPDAGDRRGDQRATGHHPGQDPGDTECPQEVRLQGL